MSDATWEYHDDPRPDVQALLGDVSGARVLDVGCGAGALGAALRAAGASWVCGIEPDPAAAARARRRLGAVVEGSVLDAALPAGPFDVVVCADVLEHLADPGAALDRLLGVLAPDGRLLVSVPNMRFWLVLARLAANRWSYADAGVRDVTHLRIFTRRSLHALLAAHGLRVERAATNPRLLDDQRSIGRLGALATRISNRTLARLAPDLMAYQHLALARRAG